MARYSEYQSPWEQKEELKAQARKHTEEMAAGYFCEIGECIQNSKIYGGPDICPKETGKAKTPSFYFLNVDSVSAIRMSKSHHKAVLNFASYKNPGGRFMDGSKAQEEMLCHESFLYNVLREFPGYYAYNNEHKNRALYTDRAIYTPDVLFGDVRCDVITCAAPNIGVGLRYGNVTKAENQQVLEKRLDFIRKIAEENHVQTLILGAYGCGVFRQDPEDVCSAIRKSFAATSVSNIVLAVPGNDYNSSVFRQSFAKLFESERSR